jgi:hypothetical protein
VAVVVVDDGFGRYPHAGRFMVLVAVVEEEETVLLLFPRVVVDDDVADSFCWSS